jgi:N-acetyl-anhydromuramyl-L-alanine amidase AmpD
MALASSMTVVVTSCTSTPSKALPRIGTISPRVGDEIVVAGQFVHTGTPVVLWMDPGGYDAYRVAHPVIPMIEAGGANQLGTNTPAGSGSRYDQRRVGLATNEIERLRGGGWDLPTLQKVVDQVVLHFDACGTSRECFRILELRGLSAHFLIDLDGTIYQILDVKERAWHATTANHRSVGIELANIGAYPPAGENPLGEWYALDSAGRTRITIPERLGDGGISTPDFIGRPARNELVRGEVQGIELTQYDYTPEQYRALAHLTAALCKVLPRIKCDYPRDEQGELINRKLSDDVLANYQGVIGHYHIQTNKTDPGPAFDWDRLLGETRRLMDAPPVDRRLAPSY